MKPINYVSLPVLLSVLLVAGISCKKETDEPPPSLSVQQPYSMQEFKIGDSIPVKASVSGSSTITSVKVVLVNENGIPMLVPRYFYPGSTSFELDHKYGINEDLDYGSYSLLVSASNASHTKKVYTEVVVNGPGSYFKQLLAVCRPNTLKTFIYSVDADGNQENILNFDYGYTDSELSSGLQQFYFLRPLPSKLLAYDLEKFDLVYSVDATPPHPEFNSLYFSTGPPLIYVPNGNGEIRGYNSQGLSAYITPSNIDTIPHICSKHQDKLLAYAESMGGPERFIRQYYSATGVYRVSLEIDFTAVAFYKAGNDRSLVFGNDESGGNSYLYDIIGNVLQEKMPLGGEPISRVVRTSETTFLVAMQNAIYKYNYQTPLISTWVSGKNVSAMVYDELRKVVYIADGQTIYMYRYPDAGLLQEVTLPYEVQNLHIHYNR